MCGNPLRRHPRHPRPEQLAPRREPHAPRLAHEERHPELLLQLAQDGDARVCPKCDGTLRHLGTDRADRIFVKAIADLAIGLGIRPIAEFVENRTAVEHLLELGIPLGQGMYFGAPASEFTAPALRATA